MYDIAERTGLIAPSQTLALDAKVKEMKLAGHDIVNYGIGEPDFETPKHIKEAAIIAIKDGFTRYTPSSGILELKEAIVDKFKVENNLTYTTDQIVASNGGKHSLYNAMQVLFQEGDEIIVPSPYWVSYPPLVHLTGAKPIIVSTLAQDNYCLQPEVLENAITPRTKGIIINSPSNPTGGAYDRKSLESLVEIIIKYDLWIISDDIYENIIFDDFKFCNLAMLGPELQERTIITHGLSKTYAMTGWRLGFMAAPLKVAQAVGKLQSQTTAAPCSITQKAAVAALRGPQDEVQSMVMCFDRRRKMTLDLLNQIPGLSCSVPKGAFYVFPDVSSFFGKTTTSNVLIRNSSDLAAYLLEAGKVAVVPGAAFGEGNALRMSYSLSDEDNKKGLRRIKEVLAILK